MTYNAKVSQEEQAQYTYENSAEARRVTLVDGPDSIITDDVILDSNEGDNIRTSNPTQEQLLTSILKEMKKMNLHLSILTDTHISNSEIE